MAVSSPSKEKMEQSESPDQSCRPSPSRAARQDGDAASETSSAHSGDPSDRRDVDLLTQALSSRSEEYRLLFRLPPDEVLVQDFNCALQENILLQGHMYLFIHHICFYSNIFGFETKKTIPFHEITCVRKAKTAAIFPNAIEIVAGVKKHFFGSFLSRDEAYRLIIDGWAQHNSDVKAHLDRQETKSETSSQDNAVDTLERVRESKQSADDASSSDRSKDTNSEECRPLSDGKSNNGEPRKVLEAQENGEEIADRLSPGEPFTWQLEDVDAPKIPEYFTLVAEAKFPVCIEDFFSLFISDNASDFLENFRRRCGDKDLQCTPWQRHEQFGHARTLSFLHPVKLYLGAKLSRCQEVQKLRVYRNSHLVIETSQQVSDVPYADYFHVEGIWDVEKKCDDDYGCILRVYINVAFSKRTMFRGKIEQSTREECREVYGMWTKNALELLKHKNLAKSEGVVDQNISMLQDKDVDTEGSSKPEEHSGQLHPSMPPSKVSQIITSMENFKPKIENPLQSNLGFSMSMASIFKESWATLVSYLKSKSHFPLFLVMAFGVILILMQMSIIVLLTRVPEVHLVTQGNHVTSLSSYELENIVWLEKRVNYLKEEMLMVESRMERMRQEYAVLKSHLQSLERHKPRS